MYNHSPKFQSLKSLGIKVKFFPKYSPNGLHGIGGKLAYVVQNCQLLEHILLWVFHWFCTVPYSLNFWIQSKILLFDGAWRHWNFLRKLACTTLYELLSEIGLHAKCLFFGWPRHGGKNYCCIIVCTKSTTTTWKRKEEYLKLKILFKDLWVLFFLGHPVIKVLKSYVFVSDC